MMIYHFNMINLDRYNLLNDAIGMLKKHPYSHRSRTIENEAVCNLVALLATRVNRKYISSPDFSNGLTSITLKSKVLC